MKIIERTVYKDYIWDVKDSPDIKVITGIRRAGKSEVMKSFVDRLKMEDANANVATHMIRILIFFMLIIVLFDVIIACLFELILLDCLDA